MGKHYRQLTVEQRYQMEALLAQGVSQKYVADQLSVHKSTVSRELRRNGSPKAYAAKTAQQMSRKRRSSSAKASKGCSWLNTRIEVLLELEFSPEQISKRIHLEHPGSQVSHEWIYRYIQRDKLDGGQLYKHLRHKRKRYRKRYGSHDRRGQIKSRISIDQRPEVVERRERIGDWEGDTVHGKNGNLVTLVDRMTGFTLIGKVKRRTAKAVTQMIVKLLKGQPCHTLTLDNGKEFAGHQAIARRCNIKVFFADPYASWQRGSNENTNGLIRQYLPKGSDFTRATKKYLNGIMTRLNIRPRKRLGWRSPFEVFNGTSVALIS